MKRSRAVSARAATLLALALGAACGGRSAVPLASAAARPGYVPADVRFFSAMIPHHGQAVLIAGWASTHGASDPVRRLAERIVVAQRDEIATLQGWLRDHHEPVPDFNAARPATDVMDEMQPPGMLSANDLSQLDAARGTEFDRLFLTLMIRHHRGAVTMADDLFATFGAAQDDFVFKLASDLLSDQAVEIDRMQQLLAELGGAPPA